MPIVPHDDVPNELWMDIFEAMDVPQDLHAVVLTCKKFYFCGIRALLRDLIWSNPKDVAANLPAWGNRYARNENAVVEPLLATDVRSLCLGVSCVPDTFQVTFVDESGQEHDGPLHVIDIDQDHDAPPEPAAHLTLKRSLRYYQLAERTHFATISLYSQMCQRIVSFTNIEKLECKNLVFTDELFGVIHSLPALRKLYVELCLFPPRQAIQARDHTLLPITELKLLNLRRRVTQGHEFAAGVNDLDDDLTHVLKLALASNLRKLHIDSTADVLGRVFTVWDNTLPGYVYHVPQNLHSLHISKKAYHHGQVQPQFAGEQFFPDRALYALFSRCPTLQTISLEYQLPRHTAFPDDCLPHLRNAEGLAEAVIAMGKNRALQAISILWSDNILYGTLESLNQIALDHGPRLKMLAVECPKWDEEVLHAVCILFPELRRLKLTFWAHGPREDTIVSLGPLFLSRLPHLHTIQVYQTQSGQVNALPTHPSVLYDSSFGSIEEEMRDLVIPWNKFCPNLRTVQLSAGWKMARVGMKGGWEVQRVRRNEPEDFTF